MTNFLIKYNSCISTNARETDFEIKIAKNRETSLRKGTRVIRTVKSKSAENGGIKGIVSRFGACASYDVAHSIPLSINQSDVSRITRASGSE